MPELFATIEALSDQRMKDFRFHASLQGVNLDDEGESDIKMSATEGKAQEHGWSQSLEHVFDVE